MRILVIDIGGSHMKLLVTGRRKPVEIPSSPELTPKTMIKLVRAATANWNYDVVSLGVPARVIEGRIVDEPPNLGKGWVGFNFRRVFGRPVHILNDAAMQALGSYTGGTMLFLGLGTGLGSALVINSFVHSLELGILPFKNGRTYAEYAGRDGLKRLGKREWTRHVLKLIRQLGKAMQPDYVVVGGGKAKMLKRLPPQTRLGGNSRAFVGGYRLWKRGVHTRLTKSGKLSSSV